MISAGINPEMLILARQIRGISQSDLAHQLNMSQGRISKAEQGLLSLDSESFRKLAKVLKFPDEFFMQPGRIYPVEINLFRKRQALTKYSKDKINALLNILFIHLNKLLNQIEVETQIPFMDIDEHGSPKEIANKLRQFWRLPEGPLENLTNIIESAGIFVLHLDLYNNQFDGLRFMADPNIPIIAINKNVPPDRMRFTLAHELGHLIMHKILTKSAEAEAHEFASEFLVPTDQIEFPNRRLNLSHFADLKRYWKISMAALITKAKEQKKISERQYQYLYAQLNQLGYRMREPAELDPPIESPKLLKKIFELYNIELGYSRDELIKLFNISTEDFDAWWGDQLPQNAKKPVLKLVRGGLEPTN
ncbi:ImmA/IrrE family metallo-endopeptidase [candidate division KSB1 bacterium]|nr:ImmA/IrrE family metallo-endopeptidase [candidate division KSB1 bacterium]